MTKATKLSKKEQELNERSKVCPKNFKVRKNKKYVRGENFMSKGVDKVWVEDPPKRISYKSQYTNATQEEQGAGTYIFIALCCVFVTAVIGCIYEVWRSARKDRRRRRASVASTVPAPGSQRWQSQQYTDPLTGGVKTVGFKNVAEDEKRPNGTHMKAAVKEYKPLANAETKDLINDKRVHIIGRLILKYRSSVWWKKKPSPNIDMSFVKRRFEFNNYNFFIADEEPEKKELLGVNTGIITKSPKLNPFVKIFSFFYKNYLY